MHNPTGDANESADDRNMVDGLGVACVGDPCSCPILGHDNCIIAEGDPHHTIDGVAVAYDGQKTSCGALLQASASSFSLA